MSILRNQKLLLTFLITIFTATSAYSDTVIVDQTKTHAVDLNRYCFKIINDDASEKGTADSNDQTEDPRIQPVASLHVTFIPEEQRRCDDVYRDNISGPEGWTGKTKGGGVSDTLGCYPVTPGIVYPRTIVWQTDDEKNSIKPGDRSGPMCFVVEGNIKLTRVTTNHLDESGEHIKQKEISGPAIDVVIDESTDKDFMNDTDKDGIPDKFDENPSVKD